MTRPPGVRFDDATGHRRLGYRRVDSVRLKGSIRTLSSRTASHSIPSNVLLRWPSIGDQRAPPAVKFIFFIDEFILDEELVRVCHAVTLAMDTSRTTTCECSLRSTPTSWGCVRTVSTTPGRSDGYTIESNYLVVNGFRGPLRRHPTYGTSRRVIPVSGTRGVSRRPTPPGKWRRSTGRTTPIIGLRHARSRPATAEPTFRDGSSRLVEFQ